MVDDIKGGGARRGRIWPLGPSHQPGSHNALNYSNKLIRPRIPSKRPLVIPVRACRADQAKEPRRPRMGLGMAESTGGRTRLSWTIDSALDDALRYRHDRHGQSK